MAREIEFAAHVAQRVHARLIPDERGDLLQRRELRYTAGERISRNEKERAGMGRPALVGPFRFLF